MMARMLLDSSQVAVVTNTAARKMTDEVWWRPMSDSGTGLSPNGGSEVDQLLRNAHLRDELEPYWDEAIHVVDRYRMPTEKENDYLDSMLAWERAPVLPVSRWFEPELALPHPDNLVAGELAVLLASTLDTLYSENILLEQTGHLSDLELYCLLMRDILPAEQKRLVHSDNGITWCCLDMEHDTETWLRYYATRDERDQWQRETGDPLPPMESPPYDRNMPQDP